MKLGGRSRESGYPLLVPLGRLRPLGLLDSPSFMDECVVIAMFQNTEAWGAEKSASTGIETWSGWTLK